MPRKKRTSSKKKTSKGTRRRGGSTQIVHQVVRSGGGGRALMPMGYGGGGGGAGGGGGSGGGGSVAVVQVPMPYSFPTTAPPNNILQPVNNTPTGPLPTENAASDMPQHLGLDTSLFADEMQRFSDDLASHRLNMADLFNQQHAAHEHKLRAQERFLNDVLARIESSQHAAHGRMHAAHEETLQRLAQGTDQALERQREIATAALQAVHEKIPDKMEEEPPEPVVHQHLYLHQEQKHLHHHDNHLHQHDNRQVIFGGHAYDLPTRTPTFEEQLRHAHPQPLPAPHTLSLEAPDREHYHIGGYHDDEAARMEVPGEDRSYTGLVPFLPHQVGQYSNSTNPY